MKTVFFEKIQTRSIFITGTDTGVGKTIVTGLLARFFFEKGLKVITQKWIQTGNANDVNMHLKLMRMPGSIVKKYLPYIMPYKFKFPASPHFASKLEKIKISKQKIIKNFHILQETFDYVLVEGIGGAFVPYNNKELVIDIVKELKLPAIIVVGNKLGAINHTLLTIEALRNRKIKILGLIFNNIDKKADKTILEDNIKIIKKLTKAKVLGALPYAKRTHNTQGSFFNTAFLAAEGWHDFEGFRRPQCDMKGNISSLRANLCP